MKTAKVKTISLSALFNTGNYEHIKYEVSVEVPDGVKAKDSFLDLLSILAALRPIKKPYYYDSAKARLMKHHDQLTEMEKEQRTEDHRIVAEYETAKAIRQSAIEKLDKIGGRSKAGGGKIEVNED